ncbi:MAG: J domain-containing protein [Chloroflexota bacterium]
MPSREPPAGTAEPHHLIDLYELLEISPRASQEVIQAAYRVLARSYHPDVNAAPGAARRIRQLNAAYEVLSDPSGRARYDLECLRAHRHERMRQSSRVGAIPRAPVFGAARGLPLQQRPVEGRLAALNGPAVLGLLMVAAVAVLLLILVSLALDAPADRKSIFDGMIVQLVRP